MVTYRLILRKLESGYLLRALPSGADEEKRREFESWDQVATSLRSFLQLDDRQLDWLREQVKIKMYAPVYEGTRQVSSEIVSKLYASF